MKHVKGSKRQNKWTLLVVGLVLCAVAGWTRTSQAAAAADEELDLLNMGYFNPFDLTEDPVSSLSARNMATPLGMNSTLDLTGLEAIAQPLKIWIPVRPTFRSPCTPSW